MQPLKKITADITHGFSDLNEGRAASAAAKGSECGLGVTRDPRCFNNINGTIEPSGMLLSKLLK
jgi:hypothetical protein